MLTRHRDALLRRLERVADLGVCEITGAELRRWYGRDRLTKTIWADILDLWTEIDEEKGNGLLIGQGEGIYTFVFDDGLTVSENSWWYKVSEWAGREPSA